MKCLIIGASGQLGTQLSIACRSEGITWIGTACQHPRPGLLSLDLRDPPDIAAMLRRVRPDVVFLCGAFTHVDRAEEVPEECFTVNVKGAAAVATAVRELGGDLVFISTEHVFPECDRAHCEDDAIGPINVYSKSKALAEARIREILPDRHLILRSSWCFGPDEQEKNFVYRAVRTLSEGKPLVVPNDQWGQPTYCPDLARAALELWQMGQHGSFHVVGPMLVNRYDYARLIAKMFDLDESGIVGVSTAELGQTAPRPRKVALSTEKVESVLWRNPIRSPEMALRRMRVVVPALSTLLQVA
jgi:dTDP-4-dehydrorhamnose reductase